MRSQCSACRTPPVGKAEALKLSQRAHTWLLAQTNTILNLRCTLLKRSVGQALLSQPCQRLAVAWLQPRGGAARCISHCPALVQAGVSTEGRSTWVEIVEEELKDSSLEMFPFRALETFDIQVGTGPKEDSDLRKTSGKRSTGPRTPAKEKRLPVPCLTQLRCHRVAYWRQNKKQVLFILFSQTTCEM